MNQQRALSQTIHIAILSLFLVLGGSLGGISIASAEENDVFEALQIMTLDEPGKAPDFSLAAVDGSTKSLSDYAGRLIFLNFWTTW